MYVDRLTAPMRGLAPRTWLDRKVQETSIRERARVTTGVAVLQQRVRPERARLANARRGRLRRVPDTAGGQSGASGMPDARRPPGRICRIYISTVRPSYSTYSTYMCMCEPNSKSKSKSKSKKRTPPPLFFFFRRGWEKGKARTKKKKSKRKRKKKRKKKKRKAAQQHSTLPASDRPITTYICTLARRAESSVPAISSIARRLRSQRGDGACPSAKR